MMAAKRDTYLVGVVGRSVAWVPGYPDVTHRPQTRCSPTNVLQHLAGYVSNRLDSDDRGGLTAMIEQYRRGMLPLIVPVTLLRHDVRKFQIP